MSNQEIVQAVASTSNGEEIVSNENHGLLPGVGAPINDQTDDDFLADLLNDETFLDYTREAFVASSLSLQYPTVQSLQFALIKLKYAIQNPDPNYTSEAAQLLGVAHRHIKLKIDYVRGFRETDPVSPPQSIFTQGLLAKRGHESDMTPSDGQATVLDYQRHEQGGSSTGKSSRRHTSTDCMMNQRKEIPCENYPSGGNNVRARSSVKVPAGRPSKLRLPQQSASWNPLPNSGSYPTIPPNFYPQYPSMQYQFFPPHVPNVVPPFIPSHPLEYEDEDESGEESERVEEPPKTPQSQVKFMNAPAGDGSFRAGGWPLSLNQALNTIPPFNGNSDMLGPFCKAVRDIVRTYGPASEPWIINSLATKLRNKAFDGYATRLSQYKSVSKLLNDMTVQYSSPGGADAAQAELKVVRQRSGESAADYGARVQVLHNRLLNIYDNDASLENWERRAGKTKANQDALEQFLFGLEGSLEHQVRSKNPSTLRDAIAQAVAFENKTGARRFIDKVNTSQTTDSDTPPSWALEILRHLGQRTINQGTPALQPALVDTVSQLDNAVIRISQSKDICTYCDLEGHQEQNCKRRKFDQKLCSYCAMRGHLFSECYALENAIRDGRISKKKVETDAIVQPVACPPAAVPVVTPCAVMPTAPPQPVPVTVANNQVMNEGPRYDNEYNGPRPNNSYSDGRDYRRDYRDNYNNGGRDSYNNNPRRGYNDNYNNNNRRGNNYNNGYRNNGPRNGNNNHNYRGNNYQQDRRQSRDNYNRGYDDRRYPTGNNRSAERYEDRNEPRDQHQNESSPANQHLNSQDARR